MNLDYVVVDGFCEKVKTSIVDRVLDLSKRRVPSEDISRWVGIPAGAVESIISGKIRMTGRAAIYLDGQMSNPGVGCPYREDQIGLRCAWLAGHYDRHGLEAWEKARR